MKKVLIILLVVITFNSCDYYFRMTGKVVDSTTGLPIENATIEFANGKKLLQTDSNGNFDISHAGAKITPIIVISKEDYKPFKLTMKRGKKEVTYIVSNETVMTQNKPTVENPSVGNWPEQVWSNHFAINDTITFYLDKK